MTDQSLANGTMEVCTAWNFNVSLGECATLDFADGICYSLPPKYRQSISSMNITNNGTEWGCVMFV